MLVERSDRAGNVKGCPRAYTLGISYEVEPNLHGPAPGNKVDPKDDENLAIRKELLYVIYIFYLTGTSFFLIDQQVATACGMAILSKIPSKLQSILQDHGQMANVPHIGHPDNCVFPNVQMNIAYPVSEISGIFLKPLY